MPTRRSGFTLIELLIVVVIIGVLATIALPKFSTTKGKANMSAMRSDLHNIAIAQEAYMYDASAYTGDTTLLRFKFSQGVQLQSMTGDQLGWSAKVTHAQAFPKTCALFIGQVSTPPTPATAEGVVACDQ